MSDQIPPDAPYGLKKDGTPKGKPGKKSGSLNVATQVSGVSNDSSGLSDLSKLNQELAAEEGKKEKAFKKELEEIIKDAEQYDGYADLQLNSMLQHPKTVKALFAATLKKLHQGDSRVINRLIDQLVGKPMQQVQLSSSNESNIKTVVGKLTTEDLLSLAKQASNVSSNELTSTSDPVGTTNDGTLGSETENTGIDPSNPSNSSNGTI